MQSSACIPDITHRSPMHLQSTRVSSVPCRQTRAYQMLSGNPEVHSSKHKTPLDSRIDPTVVKTVLRHLWPESSTGLRTRVVAALSLLIAGKVCVSVVPRAEFLRAGTDALDSGAGPCARTGH